MGHMGRRLMSLSVAAVFLAGCGEAGESSAEITVEDLGEGVMRLHGVGDSSMSSEIPDGTPGEDAGKAGVTARARDCVYVEWCNEPGRRGTICRARPECGCSGVIECNDEVRDICGGFVDPAYFLCPGQP
ncbi:hypothetical protein [Sorangium sp. So ce542]|uniref:hypothetical protein n=1 Tax=Sorangium sp. So ce542 TaxID=3133316 RepID=UPI003F6282A8